MGDPSRSQLTLILVHSGLVQLLSFAMRPTLSYAVLETGASVAWLGLVAAAFAVPALVIALPAGHIVDRVGERPALLVGGAAMLGACLLAAFAHGSVAVLLIATVILGCGHLASVVGDQALVANMPGRGSDSRFGLYSFAASVGQTVGPLLIMLPGGTETTPPVFLIFLVCAGFSLAMIAFAAFIRSSFNERLQTQASMVGTAVKLLRLRGIPQAFFASAIVLGSIDIFVAYLPALGHERAFSTVLVSAMLAVRSLMSMASRLALGKLIAHAGRRNLLIYSIVVSATALICMLFPLSAVWFIVFASFYGFAIGVCQPITMAWVSELAPVGTLGLAMSLRVASNRVGQTVLPLTFGSIAVATGAGGVLAVTGGALLSVVWAAWSLKKRR